MVRPRPTARATWKSEKPSCLARKSSSRLSCSMPLCDGEDALVGRCFQGRVQVIDMQVFVLGETVHALTYHTQAFLDSLFERAADGHHLAHGFHGTAQFAVDATELAQIPAGDLTNHVIQRGFEEGGGRFGDRVVQFEQPVPQAEFGCHKRQRIARGFGCEGR